MKRRNRKTKYSIGLLTFMTIISLPLWSSLETFDIMAYRFNKPTILKKGMSDIEVTDLAFKLSNALYLKYADVTRNKKGDLVYDSIMEVAVRHFQKDLGIEQTGEANTDYAEILSVWPNEMTSVVLGSRELYAYTGTDGYDVDELVRLLTYAGFEPDKRKLERTEVGEIYKPVSDKLIDLGMYKFRLNLRINHYIYNSDIDRALRTFQAFHRIYPDGKLTKETVKELYKYDKRGDR